ncbi:unnamed protein product (mitochondrion) [Plasmodiophora brassicae]|uniref:Uncharacterized protein n=1 Tax=Plasmodiophora brassicae TaxID=37360 RepID=A0A3P3YCK4_PLABS|nr:unnamed protein product [Plasmodiophora brassicae]
MFIGSRARLAAVSPMSMLAMALLRIAIVDATRIICSTLDAAQSEYDLTQLVHHSLTVQRKIQDGGVGCVELHITRHQLRLAITFADTFPLSEYGRQISSGCRVGLFIKTHRSRSDAVLEQFALAADHLEMRSLMVAIGWAIPMRRANGNDPFLGVLAANRHRQAYRFISGLVRLRSLQFVVRRPDPARPSVTNTRWASTADYANVLDFAVNTGEADIVEVLLDLPDIDVNHPYDPILLEALQYFAVRDGHTAIARMLVEFRGREASPLNQRVKANAVSCPNHETPLSIAAANGYVEIVRAHLQVAGIDVHTRAWYPDNAENWTLLHWAASEGHDSVVRALLTDARSTVLINAPDGRGRTPLTLAMNYGRHSVVSLLMSYGGQ